MSYKTYAEAKIASPDCEIVTTGKDWAYGDNRKGLFEYLRFYSDVADHKLSDEAWVICNPADYCSSLKEFLESGFKLGEGDKFIGIDGVVVSVNRSNSSNIPNYSNANRYILSAAALNGGCKISDQKVVPLVLQAKINEEQKMRPFNLEEAKDGKPICTRDGRSARIICTNRICGELSIVALVMSRFGTEDSTSHTLSGQYFGGDSASPMDLFMATVIEKRWIAVNPYTRAASFLHSSKEDCEDFMVCIGDSAGYQAIEVEVEI